MVIFFKVSGYVLQGVKPQKPKVLGSDTLTAFKIENAKKRIFMDTYLCVNVYNICINVHKYSYTYVYLCIKKRVSIATIKSKADSKKSSVNTREIFQQMKARVFSIQNSVS